jgi:predicted transcriptional regulator
MPYKKSKYSTEQNQAWRVAAMDVLSESTSGLTLDQIKEQNITLSPLTTQKLVRILNDLVEMGIVQKRHSKTQGRMIYMATSQLADNNYNMGMVW